jgi:ubiquinone biosynthesis protein COQ4
MVLGAARSAVRASMVLGAARSAIRASMVLGGPASSLYRGHVPTSGVGKLLLGLDAAARAIADPRQARMVGVVGEATGATALRRMRARMHASPMGRAVLSDRPALTAAALETQLHGLPPHTFGGAYAAFLEQHGFDPDERSDVQFVDDPDLAYVMTRYRQVHDLWHVLYALPPSLVGEVALKWLEAAQTGLPMTAMAAAAGGLRLKPAERAAVTRHVFPWAAAHARSGVDLMSVYYEREFARPLDELREELGVVLPPAALREDTPPTERAGATS